MRDRRSFTSALLSFWTWAALLFSSHAHATVLYSTDLELGAVKGTTLEPDGAQKASLKSGAKQFKAKDQ